jgi:hypothetical protein
MLEVNWRFWGRTALGRLQFYERPGANLEMDDFFGRIPAETVIALTFHEFSEEELKLFVSRINCGEMSVARVFDPNLGKASGSYFGFTAQHPEFVALRRIQGAAEKRERYTQLRNNGGAYAELPAAPRAVAELEVNLAN